MSDTTDLAATAVAEPGELAITELAEFDPTRLDGVKSGANGFPFLMMKSLPAPGPAEDAPDAEPELEPATEDGKPSWHAQAAALARLGAAGPSVPPAELFKAVNAAGEIDEGPDIDGGKQAMALIGKLIGFEAAEMAAGQAGEVYDIQLLCNAGLSMMCWLGGERADAMAEAMAGKSVAEDDWQGGWGYAADDVAKDSRSFTAAERKKHTDDGNALPDGSYPIPDKDALRRAAVLAQSGHGDVAAAKKLIARRAKELGVANPLDDSAASKTVVAEGATDVQTDHVETGLTKADLDEAVTKALAPSQERIQALEGELAKVLATPIPGGPKMSAAALRTAPAADGIDHAAKAAHFERMANEVAPDLAVYYRQLASEEKAKLPTP